jgi:hypothetical protein
MNKRAFLKVCSAALTSRMISPLLAGPNSLCSCVAYTALIRFWISRDGIDGSKIKYVGSKLRFRALRHKRRHSCRQQPRREAPPSYKLKHAPTRHKFPLTPRVSLFGRTFGGI